MPNLIRKKISELILLYSLEHGLSDIYTEGESDQAIIGWFLKNVLRNPTHVSVYTIDTVDVPPELVRNYNLNPGERAEIITLCLELQKEFGDNFGNVTGIIDRDHSDLSGERWSVPFLLVTDYCCLEMYFCSERALSKALHLGFQKVGLTAAKMLEEILPIATELFAVRLANQSLGLYMKWIEWGSFTQGASKLRFDRDHFVRAYLGANQAMDKKRVFEREVDRILSEIAKKGLCCINGHDLVQLIGISIRRFYSKAKDTDRTRPHTLAPILACCLDLEYLKNEPMFRTLLSRIALAVPDAV